ncbi:MAG: PKD domain-containing protein, partial [Bacteroidota bacterium]
ASFSASPTSGTAPLAVNFDASASSDDNGITSYSWDFGDGSTGNGVNTSHSYTNPGQYVATLTVSDQEGLTNSTTKNITVQSANNGNCFAEVNGQVVIEAEDFSRVNPGSGNAAGTSWTVVSETNASGGSAVEAGPNTGLWTGLNLNGPRLDFDIEFSETGIYYIYIRSQGPSGNDDSYHVGLNGSGISNLSAYGMGGSGPWSWQSIANDDEVMQLNIQSVGKQTFNVWVREDGVQIDKIVLKKASGNPSGQGPAASQQSPCGGNANQAPISSFTATPSTGAAPLQVSVDAGSSSDPDGSIASYSWDFGDGTQATGQTASHTYTSVGIYTLSLTVTDNQGLSNSSTRTINATPPANGPLCFEEKNGAVVIEAENFSATSAGSGNASANNWQKFTDINASNSEGIRAVPNNGVWTGLNTNGPRVDYRVLFETAGTYRVYIRTQGPTNQDDSYHIGLNGTAVSTNSGYGMGWTGNWGWAYFANDDNFVEVVVPSTGEHTFNIWMREDGVEIDKIVMKIQPGTPSGQGPAASAQVECGTTNNAFANNNKSFSMKESGGNGEINWGNFFEEFKDNYILERSIDGVTYESLESDEIIVDQLQNTHTDPEISQYGVSAVFYRLRIRDQRGMTRETRRGVLRIGSGESLFDFKIYPNPATDKLNLEFDNASGKTLSLTILNSLGQSMYTDQIEGDQTDGIIRLDVSEYAQGIYFIRLSDNEKSRIVRVLVE